jgi:hypothetical protein
MPLNTEIIRNGESLKLNWGEFHVAAMILATIMEDFPMKDVGSWTYNDGEYEGKTEKDYPEVPLPIGWAEAFRLVDYGVIGNTRLGSESVVLTKVHRFLDITDRELFELFPGDILKAYRSSK